MAHDPDYQLVPEPKEAPFDPAKTALVVVDLQHGCAHPDGLMGRLARETKARAANAFDLEFLPEVARKAE
jgi:nicotinamidase-related amidase